MRKKSNLSERRKSSRNLLVRGSRFEDCLLPPGAVKNLVLGCKLPPFSSSTSAFAQQVTTLPRIQQWKDTQGGEPATQIIRSNLVVFEDETFKTILLAYKSNLLSANEAKEMGKEASELHQYGEYAKRSEAKQVRANYSKCDEVLVGLDTSLRNFMSVDMQPAKDKHGMKMSGYTMPLKYQREGSPVICRSAFRSVPLIINFQHDTLDFSRGVLALLEPMTSPMWKCSRGVHPNVQGASQVQTVSAGVGDRRSTTL